MPHSRYVRHLIRNDQVSPQAGLALFLTAIKPSKFAREKLPTSLPKNLHAGIILRVREEKLEDVSSYIAALAMSDLAAPNKSFEIIPWSAK